jgi:dihydrofolate synthase/folylpolyglutamate synthase
VIISDISLSTHGQHQRDNAATAVQAARLIHPELRESQVRERLASCHIPGRQQLLAGRPDVLLDVAHNPASFEALAATLRIDFGDRRIAAVIGMMKDKDVRECSRHLQGMLSEVWVVSANSPRAYPADELAALLTDLGFTATAMQDRDEAFAALHAPLEHDLGLVTGSFYLAGDYLTWRQRAGIA